jgi:hypothetical protein
MAVDQMLRPFQKVGCVKNGLLLILTNDNVVVLRNF